MSEAPFTFEEDAQAAIEAAAIGATGIRYADVQLTDAQIKALPTTPVRLVAPAGAGYTHFLMAAYLLVSMPTTAYGNIGDGAALLIRNRGTHGNGLFSIWWSETHGQVSQLLFYPGSRSIGMNQLDQDTPTGNITGGQADGDDMIVYDNAGIYLVGSNTGSATGAFTGGDPENTLSVRVWYAVVPTTPFGA